MIKLNPTLAETYKVSEKVKTQEFNHAVLGKVNFATITAGMAKKLEKKGYLIVKEKPAPKAVKDPAPKADKK